MTHDLVIRGGTIIDGSRSGRVLRYGIRVR
jgi:hypothetical protein